MTRIRVKSFKMLRAQHGRMRCYQRKTNIIVDLEIAVPIRNRLRVALADAPKHSAITVLASPNGGPWTHHGSSSAFHRLKSKLLKAGHIEAGLTMIGLRHTVATTLRVAG